ncbi:hypothetical protein HMPREF9123_1087 [Neisseria bacilliformis ATCC BAA-1200]|uniref:Uncharacterized protein n=1 Tax=Neisseria bacilliformis ATCC BAA-1200 TaxID=888742 RepID=F2BBI2_9NEIS|nr:hypothetical protein HMPREF9123_1087 [Neisseria bacilliformis ATCC BAA-1200]
MLRCPALDAGGILTLQGGRDNRPSEKAGRKKGNGGFRSLLSVCLR